MRDISKIPHLSYEVGVLQDQVERLEMTAYLGGSFYDVYREKFRELVAKRTVLGELTAERDRQEDAQRRAAELELLVERAAERELRAAS